MQCCIVQLVPAPRRIEGTYDHPWACLVEAIRRPRRWQRHFSRQQRLSMATFSDTLARRPASLLQQNKGNQNCWAKWAPNGSDIFNIKVWKAKRMPKAISIHFSPSHQSTNSPPSVASLDLLARFCAPAGGAFAGSDVGKEVGGPAGPPARQIHWPLQGWRMLRKYYLIPFTSTTQRCSGSTMLNSL